MLQKGQWSEREGPEKKGGKALPSTNAPSFPSLFTRPRLPREAGKWARRRVREVSRRYLPSSDSSLLRRGQLSLRYAIASLIRRFDRGAEEIIPFDSFFPFVFRLSRSPSERGGEGADTRRTSQSQSEPGKNTSRAADVDDVDGVLVRAGERNVVAHFCLLFTQRERGSSTSTRTSSLSSKTFWPFVPLDGLNTRREDRRRVAGANAPLRIAVCRHAE